MPNYVSALHALQNCARLFPMLLKLHVVSISRHLVTWNYDQAHKYDFSTHVSVVAYANELLIVIGPYELYSN